MNKKVVLVGKTAAIILGYILLFSLTVFFTVSLLVKGDEIVAPDLTGKTLQEAYALAARKGVFLKKVVGDFGAAYAPNTVVSQFPAAQTSVKEKSVIKIFVASPVGQTLVPRLLDLEQRECEALLKKNKLKKGHTAILTAPDVIPDRVIGQSLPAGGRVAEGSAVSLLVSKGGRSRSFIMPDLIGKEAVRVLVFFESRGLKISKIEEVPYFGLQPGIILKQFPSPGFEISSKNLIGIQVSK
ncbi:MAG: PASTA domain-containing protein [Candidatus Aminicenantes bacterium]|nr:PASTA domain-containing protein [Candidatus Aminicenantes bacterium]